jgi:hypothetical protein
LNLITTELEVVSWNSDIDHSFRDIADVVLCE